MRPAAFSAADSSLDAGDPNRSVSTFSQPEGLDHLLHSDQGRWLDNTTVIVASHFISLQFNSYYLSFLSESFILRGSRSPAEYVNSSLADSLPL